MTHLSSAERLELIEAEEPPRHPHLDACVACRIDVEALRAAISDARAVNVPEPSPLFWDHFSARVAERLRNRPSSVGERVREWAGWRALATSAASLAVIALAIVAIGDWRFAGRPGRDNVPSVTADAIEAPAVEAGVIEAPAAGDDGEWLPLSDAVADFDVETVCDSIGVRGGAGAENAVWALSAIERAELARLLQAEMRRTVSGS